jgi:Ni/Co efflux regulator RcnB
MTSATRQTLGILALGTLLSTLALADKPPWAGAGKGKGNDRSAQAQPAQGGSFFADRHRVTVREYYGGEYQRGHCPPGLAKKNNGCMPPGQAKKWHVGRPLPREVIFYNLPPSLVVSIGAPPAGHRYVRVAADILLIAIGTGMVVDAIEDLGRL